MVQVIPHSVLMTTDTIGGVWSYALSLSAGLAKRGVHVALATLGPPPSPGQREQIARLHDVLLFEGAYSLEWMDAPWSEVDASGRWVLELEAQLRPSLCHFNTYAHAALPTRAPRLVVGHSCVLSWWQETLGESPPQRYSEYAARVRSGLQHAGAVVAPSAAMLRMLERHYRPLPHACVIPNGVALEHWSPGRKRPQIAAAGRVWDAGKNLQALAQVASQLHWPVFVAGQSASGSQPGGAPSWHALGHVPQARLQQLLAETSIFVHPARYEPFGLAPLEAAACGCALVLGDIPSLREVWDDAALYAKPDDPEHLKFQIRRLEDDSRLRDAYAAKARAQAQKYPLARSVAGYLSLYEQLLAGTRQAQAHSH